MSSESTSRPDAFHPSVRPLFAQCRRWLEHAPHQASLQMETARVSAWLASPDPLPPAFGHAIERLGHHHAIAACDACGRGDADDIARHLRRAVDFRALPVRMSAAYARAHPDAMLEKPSEYWDSMRAAGPSMLGMWEAARIAASGFVLLAERDLRMRAPASRRLRHGTNDAFLIALFAQGLGVATDFTPAEPLVPVYRALLDGWRSTDGALYRAAMSAAAEFHIERSRDGTDRRTYEFEKDIDRVFPAELLMVQALRRREGLPEFEAGHALVDAPWAILRALPATEPHPLFAAAEARLKAEKPAFE